MLSLLLCMSTVMLWVRSYWNGDGYRNSRGGTTIDAESRHGWICIIKAQGQPAGAPHSEYYSETPTPMYFRRPVPGEVGVRRYGNVPGFAWFITDGGYSNSVPLPGLLNGLTFMPHQVIYLSHAVLFGMTAAMSGIMIRWTRRRKNPDRGMCVQCGYDLRATPDRCPECGTIPTKAKAAEISN